MRPMAEKGGDKSVKTQSQGKINSSTKKGKVLKMARERMITRTIAGIQVNVMGIDTASNTVAFQEYDLSGTFKSDAEIIEAIKAQKGNAVMNGFIPVQVQSKEETETLYGMPESLFMEYAKVLPPRTKAD